MKDMIIIDGLTVKKGDKGFAFLEVKDKFGYVTELPTGIINGIEVGPVLLVTAGLHGCEYDGIEAATRLYKELSTDALHGGLVIITCMNLPSLRMRTPFVVPLDNRNLNYSFPGRQNGSAAEVIAYTIQTNFLPVADYMIDCHGGDIGEAFLPITMAVQTDDEKVSLRSKELAGWFGLDYSYYDDARAGAHASDPPGPRFDGSWLFEANKAGIPAIASEAGCDGQCKEQDVLIHMKGVRNVMRHLRMISDAIEKIGLNVRTSYFRSMFVVKAFSPGIFYPRVKLGSRIANGDILAELRDLKGDLIEEVKAPDNGVVFQVNTRRFVNSGERLYLAFGLQSEDK